MRAIDWTLCSLLLMVGSQGAFGQDCPAVDGVVTEPSIVVSGDTCGGHPGFTSVCAGQLALNGAGSAIYRMDIGSKFPIEAVSLQSSSFAPSLAVLGPPCNAATSCLHIETATLPGSVTVQLGSNPPAGTYYVIVGDTVVETPGCGAYSLAFFGFIPVELQSFDIE